MIDDAIAGELRRRRAAGQMTEEQIAAIDAAHPGFDWDPRIQRTFEERLAEAVAFREREGRLPRTSEGQIGIWLRKRRALRRPDEMRRLDEALPGWDRPQPAFEDRVAELRRFLDEHSGRLPRTDEGELGVWLSTRRRKAAPWQRRILDEQFPGWDRPPGGGPQATFEQRCRQLEAFRAEHGRDPGSREGQGLGAWLSDRRRGAPPWQRRILDERLPGWEGTRRPTFEDRLRELGEWMREHGRPPSSREGSLGMWLSKQRRADANPEHVARLDAELPGWR